MTSIPATGGETILVADDDDTIRRLIAIIFRRQGFFVIEAVDGADALARADRHAGPIHLLVTDIDMPRLNGSGLWQRVLALHPESKVLFITGRTGNLQPACQPVLQKPFRMAELLGRVKEILSCPSMV